MIERVPYRILAACNWDMETAELVMGFLDRRGRERSALPPVGADVTLAAPIEGLCECCRSDLVDETGYCDECSHVTPRSRIFDRAAAPDSPETRAAAQKETQ